MEKEHTQSVVERAYAFVEDMFGLEHERQAPEEHSDHHEGHSQTEVDGEQGDGHLTVLGAAAGIAQRRRLGSG